LWISKGNYTIQKVEAYNKKGLVRVIEYKDYELVSGVWTARTAEVFDESRKSRTTLKYEKLEYNLPFKDEEFTLQALRRE
jgi:outer membrane lipoprotein-sorting protein